MVQSLSSKKLIDKLEDDGWILKRVSGSHHVFKHPNTQNIITVSHPRKDLPTGTLRKIYRIAGWK